MSDEIKLSENAKKVVVGGTYEHYKGMVCKVLGVALHSETLKEMVVYQHLDKEGIIWVRPLEMFLENVEIDGVTKARFRLISEK